MRIVNESGCWPTPKQELLVKAALLRGEAAITAFEQWNTPGSLDETDHASFRLLPLLYQNLLRHGYQHPAMQLLKGVHRRAWFENQQLFRHFAPSLEILRKADIPVVLLKGAALVRLYYADDGLRPMSDVDLLVPTERAMEALGLLRAAGWRPDPPAYEPRRESHLRFRHALCLRGPNQAEIDLHWHATFLARWPGVDAEFWEAAVPFAFNGCSVRALCPADQLLIVCLHGAMWDETIPLRWIADAYLLLESADVDWKRVMGMARRLKVQLYLRETLHYVRRLLEARVPDEVLGELDAVRVSGWEVDEYERMQESTLLQDARGTVRAHYNLHRRGTRDRSRLMRWMTFPAFLQFQLEIATRRELAVHCLRWTATRVGWSRPEGA